MATFNGDQRLKLAIESILVQDYLNWEFIIVDDASTSDLTKSILNLYSDHSKVKIFTSPKNLGLAGALNIAIAESTGELLVRMDDDDFSYQMRISRLVEAIIQMGFPAVIGSCANIIDDSGLWGTNIVPLYPNIKDIVLSRALIHVTTILNKSALLRLGGYKSSNSTMRLEDIDLWLRLFENGETLLNIPDVLVEYYEANTSVKKRSFEFRLREFRFKILWIKKLRLHLGIKTIVILKFIGYVLIPSFAYRKYRKWRFK